MELTNFDKQFVERTKIIVKTMCTDDYPYNATLLLNCLVGLISLPTERTRPNNAVFISTCVDKLKEMGVITRSTTDEKTFRAIKNAISHMYVDAHNADGIITSIVIADKLHRNTDAHTELQFTMNQLKEFALFVADKHLERFY